jgi:hypothetical protein
LTLEDSRSSRGRIRYYERRDKYDDTCGYDCIEDKTGEALDIMLSGVGEQNEQCFGQAESLRQEILSEIQALRESLTQESADRANGSISALNQLLEESLDMLSSTLNDIKYAIDEEKAAVVERVK